MRRGVHVLSAVLAALALIWAGLVAPLAFAADGTGTYPQWATPAGSPPTSTGDFGITSFPNATAQAQPTSAGFTKEATIAVASSATLTGTTPFGQRFGTSSRKQYLSIGGPSNATQTASVVVTFDSAAPGGRWAFALGDVDAEKVTVTASGPSGALTSTQLGWQGGFNYSSAGGPIPTWDSVNNLLTGASGTDTNGETGWFAPTVDVTSITLTQESITGFPTYQLWIATDNTTSTPICESGVLPDGTNFDCFLSGTTNWTVPMGVEEINYLVVGGGGGGGADNAGGGGAGGFVESSSALATTPGETLTIIVGEGGAAGTGVHPNSTRGTSGADSAIQRGGTDIARAIGGGGGGAGQAGRESGLNGGSGGGSAGEASTGGTPGTGTAGQGTNGGTDARVGSGGGGGGGGATAAGSNASGLNGGNGGAGKSSTIMGTSTYFAGGGGGSGDRSTNVQGTGGIGGGGNAGNPARAGTPNTGGGGGGGSFNGTTTDGAAGGRGIVIVSYTLTSHNITYNANGGVGAPASDAALTGETITVSSTTPTRSGYTFTGWKTGVSSGTAYAAGDPLVVGSSDQILYAQWTPITYTLTYDLNGASGTAPTSTDVDYGATANVTATTPTRTGFWFNGWNSEPDGTGSAYASSTSFTMLGNVTLYAQWVPDIYDLAFNANGGEGAPAAETRAASSTANLPLGAPTRTGYTFAGWNTLADGTGPTTYSAGQAYTMPGVDTVLFAKWTAVNYTLTYDARSGSPTPTSPDKSYLSSVTVDSTPPTLSGYVFAGWNTASNGSGATYAPGGTFLMPAENLTLYAQWIGDTKEVLYDLDGGEGGPPDTPEVPGSTITIPSVEPTKSGSTFQSWNTESDGTGTTYAPGGTFTMPSQNVVLHARWSLNPNPNPNPESPAASTTQFTVIIDANQGSCTTTSITGAENSWVKLPTGQTCTRPGYTLIGFGVNADASGASGTLFAPGGSIQLTGNNRLYAIWAKNSTDPAAFICTANLYQISGTGGGVMYVYDPVRNTMDLVPPGGGATRAPGSNAIGFNPGDNYVYGIAPNGANRHLWKYGSNGVYQDLGAIILESTGAPVTNLSFVSGDFIASDVLLAIQTPNRMMTVDIAPTRQGRPATANLHQPPTDVWSAADIAFDSNRTFGYGLSSSTLFIAELSQSSLSRKISAIGQGSSYSRKTVLGVPVRGTYGAAYIDQDSNAYFYNNEERRMYLITASELKRNQPTAVPLGTEKAFVLGTDQTLQVPTDGASCPTAPIVTVALTYRINGGKGEAPSNQNGFVDQAVTVAPAIGFEREGFTFTGWNSAADGSGASYGPGALYSLGASGGVLYAQWKPAEIAPVVPSENILNPIIETKPPVDEGGVVIFDPIKNLPTDPTDPWNPTSTVLVDPDDRIMTPVAQDESGNWFVNNRTGDVSYTPDPEFSGPSRMTMQIETVSGTRYQTTLQTTVPSCQRGAKVTATVYFDALKSNVTAESKRVLNRLVRKATRQGVPTCAVVVGYVQPTPNRGNDLSLSTSRAESVADYLDARGITRIIKTEGLGRANQQDAVARRATATIYLVWK